MRFESLMLCLFFLLGASFNRVYAQTHPVDFAVRTTNGALPNDHIFSVAVTPDGTFLAFGSNATNLVSTTDLNTSEDVFVLNRGTGEIEMVSVNLGGDAGNGPSFSPSISADGRFVVFSSLATDLVAGDVLGGQDIFVRDRQLDQTFRVSVARDGSEANASSFSGKISANGRFVAFSSIASNLLPSGGDSNALEDVFVQDLNLLRAGTFTGLFRASVADQSGAQATGSSSNPFIALSDAGEVLIAFSSNAANLVTGDTNGRTDTFIRNLTTGRTERASLTSSSVQGNQNSFPRAFNANGRFVVFSSTADNFVLQDTNRVEDCFLKDRQTGELTRVSVGPGGIQGNGECDQSAISDDGRFVLFESEANSFFPNLYKSVDEISDIYLRDRLNNITLQISLTQAGGPTFDDSQDPVMTADGSLIFFTSESNEIVSNDNNSGDDAFVVSDQCPSNPEKLAPGVCGCSALDVDTDEDGTLDCQDQCPNDPTGDANNNGAADCLDPDGNTVPTAPTVSVKRKNARVTMQSFPGSGMNYRATISGRRSQTKNSRNRTISFNGLPSGRYSIQYAVTFKGRVSQLSAKKSFRIR